MKRLIRIIFLHMLLTAALCFSACKGETPAIIRYDSSGEETREENGSENPEQTLPAESRTDNESPDPSSEVPDPAPGISGPSSEVTEPSTEVSEPSEEETEPVPEVPDPALNVLDHYSDMFIVTNVNTYLNMRNAPSTGGTVIGKIAKNGGGEILEDLGGWLHVRSGGKEGFVAREYCILGEEARALAPGVAVELVQITAERLNVRTGPGLEYSVRTKLGAGSRLPYDEDLGDWYMISINGSAGYISKEFAEAGWYLQEAIPWTSIAGASETRQRLIRYAEQFMGIPYRMGGTSLGGGGIDCSSYVQQCLRNAIGVSLGRTSRQQAGRGYAVSLANAKPGDLLFYADAHGTIDHVAFYMGDGMILHASRTYGGVSVSTYNYLTEPVLIKNVIGD